MDRDRLRACSNEDLISSSREVAARLAATHGALLDIIAVIDEREVWRSDGCLSMQDWVAFTYQVSRKTAHEWVDAARALGDLPALSEAFAAGELSWDKTKAVSELASPDSDWALTDEARHTDVRHLERAARKARAVSLEEANQRHRDRFLSLRRSITMGGVRVSGFLPDVDGETVIKAIEQLADDVPKDPETGLWPRLDERCADALVDLAAGFLAAEQPIHGDRRMIVAHVDLSAEPGADTHPECESGMTLSNETLQRLMCDAVIESVYEMDGKTIGTGKKHRTPPQWMRRQLVHRDEGCRFNGCVRTRMLHSHHIKHWPGGPTQPDNLVMLCRYHHRLVHEGGWTVRGDPEGRLEFVKAREIAGPDG